MDLRTGPPYSSKRQRGRDKALKALIKRSGSLSALAAALPINPLTGRPYTRQAVAKWVSVPDRHIKALEAAFPAP